MHTPTELAIAAYLTETERSLVNHVIKSDCNHSYEDNKEISDLIIYLGPDI